MKRAKTTLQTEKKTSQQRIQIRLHPEKDADIIDYLSKEKHITNTVKKLLREKIWQEKNGLQFVPMENSLPNSGIADSYNDESSPFVEEEIHNVFLDDEAFTQPEETTGSSDIDLFD